MSTVKSKNLQVGTDATATNNFTIYQPSTPDGTLRIGVGNADSPTEVAQFTSAGMVSGATSLSTASGSAPSYSARAWVNFNGTGTVAIRDSGNVSSITDNAVGIYTVNFTTAMPDTNYVACGMSRSQGGLYQNPLNVCFNDDTLPQLSSCKHNTNSDEGSSVDGDIVTISYFR